MSIYSREAHLYPNIFRQTLLPWLFTLNEERCWTNIEPKTTIIFMLLIVYKRLMFIAVLFLRMEQQRFVHWHGHPTIWSLLYVHLTESFCYLMNKVKNETNFLWSQLMPRYSFLFAYVCYKNTLYLTIWSPDFVNQFLLRWNILKSLI